MHVAECGVFVHGEISFLHGVASAPATTKSGAMPRWAVAALTGVARTHLQLLTNPPPDRQTDRHNETERDGKKMKSGDFVAEFKIIRVEENFFYCLLRRRMIHKKFRERVCL